MSSNNRSCDEPWAFFLGICVAMLLMFVLGDCNDNFGNGVVAHKLCNPIDTVVDRPGFMLIRDNCNVYYEVKR